MDDRLDAAMDDLAAMHPDDMAQAEAAFAEAEEAADVARIARITALCNAMLDAACDAATNSDVVSIVAYHSLEEEAFICLDAVGAREVAAHLGPQVRTLRLYRQPIGAGGLAALLEAPNAAGLTILVLVECGVGAGGLRAIDSFLKGPGLALTFLDVSDEAGPIDD